MSDSAARVQSDDLQALQVAFPGLSLMGLDEDILCSPLIRKLANLINFSIPLHTFAPPLLLLYDRITLHYHSALPPDDQTLPTPPLSPLP